MTESETLAQQNQARADQARELLMQPDEPAPQRLLAERNALLAEVCNLQDEMSRMDTVYVQSKSAFDEAQAHRDRELVRKRAEGSNLEKAFSVMTGRPMPAATK